MQGALQEHIVLGNIFRMLCGALKATCAGLRRMRPPAVATPGKGAVRASLVAPPDAKTR